MSFFFFFFLLKPYWPGFLWPNVSLMKEASGTVELFARLDTGWKGGGSITTRRSWRPGCLALPACLSLSLAPWRSSVGGRRSRWWAPEGLGWCGHSSRYCCRHESEERKVRRRSQLNWYRPPPHTQRHTSLLLLLSCAITQISHDIKTDGDRWSDYFIRWHLSGVGYIRQ